MPSIVGIISMKHTINSAADLGLVIRAVRKSTHVRQDDLAGAVRVSRQFTHDVEQGKPTVQLGRVLLLLEELGIALNVDIPDEASRTLATLQPSRARARRNTAQRQVSRVEEESGDPKA
jgi:transcriptional regulator with XRE-family HTH domain